jgi:hypothetical protein
MEKIFEYYKKLWKVEKQLDFERKETGAYYNMAASCWIGLHKKGIQHGKQMIIGTDNNKWMDQYFYFNGKMYGQLIYTLGNK